MNNRRGSGADRPGDGPQIAAERSCPGAVGDEVILDPAVVLAANIADATVDTEPELRAEAARAAVAETRCWLAEQDEGGPGRLFDVEEAPPHPAAFSDALLGVIASFLEPGSRVVDPFAGRGGIHRLRELAGVETVGVEIQPKWAAWHPDTICGNALEIDFPPASFDAVVTSPTFGDRLADHHEARDGSVRRSYRHDYGEDLEDDNSGLLQWGPAYRSFHERIWTRLVPVIRPGGRFILDVKDHIRGGVRQPVSAWHVRTLLGLGLEFLDCVPVAAPGMRFGANREARVDAHLVWAFTKGERR